MRPEKNGYNRLENKRLEIFGHNKRWIMRNDHRMTHYGGSNRKGPDGYISGIHMMIDMHIAFNKMIRDVRLHGRPMHKCETETCLKTLTAWHEQANDEPYFLCNEYSPAELADQQRYEKRCLARKRKRDVIEIEVEVDSESEELPELTQ